MNQRLIWNFEFSTKKSTPVNCLPAGVKDSIKWEARFFWPDTNKITLFNIDDSLLSLANYKQKHRNDCYYILPDSNHNIKRRHNKLLYKPVLQRSDHAVGFGPKINLDDLQACLESTNPTTAELQKILGQTQKTGKLVDVKKEALIYKFPTTPAIKIELARLEVHQKIYFSVCIEGRSLYLVETISEHLLGTQVSCEYVIFLKDIQIT